MDKLLTLGLCIVVIMLFLGLLPISGEEEIYDSVIRFHVVANSNSESDQTLKFAVRDAVIEKAAVLLDGITEQEEAAAILKENSGQLAALAESVLTENGCPLKVSVTLEKEDYPTRSYGTFRFPSGEYLSFRILIGEAAGENFWCVLFPSLCVSAATESMPSEGKLAALGLSGDQYRIITDSENGEYEVKFKILETLEELFG